MQTASRKRAVDYIESIGQSALASITDLRKTASCPDCGQQSLEVNLDQFGNLTVVCKTPNGIDMETSNPIYCGFFLVVKGTDLRREPFSFSFEEPKKKPIRQKSGARRPVSRPAASTKSRKSKASA